jgi:hypothetical protein
VKSQRLSTVFKKTPGINVGLVLVRDQDPSPTCIGVLLESFRSMVAGVIGELEHKDENRNARTRLVYLKRSMPVGSEINPLTDLQPIRQQANR